MDTETNRAYLVGLKLKHAGLSEEVIYARLEKQGFSEALARQVARDVIRENEREQMKASAHYGLVIAAIGLIGTIVSYFIFEDGIYVFPGLLIAGIGGAFWLFGKQDKA
jgi:hypothetical protein